MQSSQKSVSELHNNKPMTKQIKMYILSIALYKIFVINTLKAEVTL